MSRPRAAPALVAALTAQAPARLVKKLDAAPRAAEVWRWTERSDGVWTVETDGGEVVSLTPLEGGALAGLEAVRCGCLLAPRCFHLLAVVSSLELADGPAATLATATAPPATGSGELVPLEPEQRRAAAEAWRAASALLATGAAGAGPTLQAELLRSVHSCRAAGLVRLASAGVRAVTAVRDLRADRPEFDLPALALELLELLGTARALGGAGHAVGEAPRARIGVARRAYESVGALRLHGLCTEAVIASSGWAGVVTHLVDATGRVWTVSAVEPGGPGRVAAAYDAPAAIGDATLAHRALGREGLFVQDATGSADGRLGAGKGVRAVRAGPSPWSEPSLARLWDEPLEAQLARAAAALDLPPAERPGGADLLFVRARVLGRRGDALVLAGDDERLLACAPPSDHEVLHTRDALRVLAHAPGLALRCVARPDRRGALTLLAAGEDDAGAQAGPRLRLPAEWGGRLNVGLDRLGHAAVEGGAPGAIELPPAPEPTDALAPVRRRLQRLALGGRSATSPGALLQVEQEAKLLERRLLPTAAALHRALAVAALGRGDLASAWLACAVYERAASRG